MNLSKDTLDLLGNFATINSNVVLKPGQKLKTISEAKNIMAIADIVEDFPKDMGIYDLNEFLATHSLVEDAQLVFEDNAVVIKNNTNTVRYFFAEPSILTSPDKDVTMPECEVQITLTEEVLAQLRRAASVLGHIDIAFIGNDQLTLKVFDSKDASANTFEIDLGPNTTGHKFEFAMNIANLKFVDGEYEVFISSKLISKWVHKTKNVTYFVALEKTSSFGV